MRLSVNGETRDLADGATVTDVLHLVRTGDLGRGLAVAVNGEVVPRGEWDRTRLWDADRVEVLVAIGGG